MKTLYILFSSVFIIILIYYYYIHDFIFVNKNRVVVKNKPQNIKNNDNSFNSELKSEEIFRDYILQDGDVNLSINKKKSDFTKTIIRKHRLETDFEETNNLGQNSNPNDALAELKNYNDYELEGSAFDNYENYVNLITSINTKPEIEYPKLEDITILKETDVNSRNPITPAEYLLTLESYLENPELINEEMGIEDEINLLLQKNNAYFEDSETKESEILIDLEKISEKISDNKENILNFNADLSNASTTPNDNILDFGEIDFDETV